MRLLEYHDILNASLFQTSNGLRKAWNEVVHAIEQTDWPHGSGAFTICPEKHANGVKPIKLPCMKSLINAGWKTETLPNIQSTVLRTGDLDALKETPEGFVAFEWETGNISSSHRALNKLFLTMQQTNILGSLLVVPSDNLKHYLTDRVGNIGELKPYFPLWQTFQGIQGALRIIVVEHDTSSSTVLKIPKGTDGRARR